MPGAPPSPPRLFLVDGYALIYRAFFAMIARPLTTSRGENTSAAWGITNFLLRLRQEHRPEYLGWVHDVGESFRHRSYPEYKATRQKLTDQLQQDFNRSVERISELLEAFRVPVLGVEGFEADDVIGTLAARAAAQRGAGGEGALRTVIVSGDKDFYQLVGPGVVLLNPGRGGPAAVEAHFVDQSNAAERLGVPPEQVVDFLALVGDSSDNVPGVKGIGEKTAAELLREFGDLDAILANASTVRGKRAREALLAHRDEALLSRDLVTIRRDAPIGLDLDALRVKTPDRDRLVHLLTELEFRSLIPQLDRLPKVEVEDAAPVVMPAPAPPASQLPPARIVDDPAALAAAVAEIRRDATILALDTEASSPDPLAADLVGLALATGPGCSWYFSFAHVRPEGELSSDPPPKNLPPLSDPRSAPLAELLRDASVPKAGHNVKYDLLVLRRAGVDLAGVSYDSMLASFVLNPGRRSHALDELVREQLQQELRTQASLTGVGRGRDQRPVAEVAVAAAASFSAANAEAVLRLREAFAAELEDHALRPLLDQVEVPLIGALAAMEWRGIRIDVGHFADLARTFAAEQVDLERSIYDEAGTDFNINSTQQLRHVLFEKLQLPVLKKTKTGASTDVEVLEQLAAAGHQLPRLLIEYRELAKLKSTYVDVLPQRVNQRTGRIHTSFNQTGAATGRLSSSEPNLQNIPVRTPRGEAIRRGFVPGPGCVLLVADYSQIELRLLAHLSGDPAFVEAFRHGGDIHRQTASVIFGDPPEAVTPEMRARAKTINFATIYGQGPFALSRQLGITQDEARAFIDQYFHRFAGVRAWLDRTVEEARAKGYVETIFGRRRYVPELKERNFNIRAFGERTATNSPLQGSAADLIKVAMIRIHQALRERRLSAAMLLQVHDELVFEVPEAEVAKAKDLAKRHMETAAELRVPLVVTVGVGPNWLDAKG
ncbi:MAG: DNA polymerase I [Gemmatimonadales bacterium]